MAAVRHIGFVVTSSYFIRILCITFLTLFYIFISIGLVLSDILGVSCFIILAGNCLFRVKFLGFSGVNRGHISIFHFITQKRHNDTSFRDSASFEPLRVKICPEVSSLRWSEKKNNKVTQKVIFNPFATLPRSPRERIFTKFGTNVPRVNVINPDKLCVQGFRFYRVQKFPFFP